MQLTHYNSKFKQQTFPITLVCDGVTNASNIGSLFRISDAFGVEQIIFCGENLSVGRRIKKTSRATEKYVKHTIINDIIDAIHQLKSNGYQLIALEITDKSIPINQFKLNNKLPIAIVVGNENFGVSEAIINHCDSITHINMFGKNSSMNVVMATGIALYTITNSINNKSKKSTGFN